MKYVALFLNKMNKLRYILLYVLLLVVANNIWGQNISLSNNEITIQIISTDSLNNSIDIIIKNTSNKIILISMIDSINNSKNYIGIGLYSSLFPYIPNYFTKYTKELHLLTIEPNDSLVFKQQSDILSNKNYSISIDYMVKSERKTKISREIYDNNISFLKYRVSR